MHVSQVHAQDNLTVRTARGDRLQSEKFAAGEAVSRLAKRRNPRKEIVSRCTGRLTRRDRVVGRGGLVTGTCGGGWAACVVGRHRVGGGVAEGGGRRRWRRRGVTGRGTVGREGGRTGRRTLSLSQVYDRLENTKLTARTSERG